MENLTPAPPFMYDILHMQQQIIGGSAAIPGCLDPLRSEWMNLTVMTLRCP